MHDHIASTAEHEFSARLMGCDAHVSIVHADGDEARALFADAMTVGRTFERTFSRFDPSSELSQLNRERTMAVSPLFQEAFRFAQQLFDSTSGVFNPLFRVRSLGYDRTFSEVGDRAVCDDVAYNTDFSSIEFDVARGVISLRDDQELDFGGFVKCQAAQEMAAGIRGVAGVVVNIGGDLYVRGADGAGKDFTFSVYDPVHDRYPLAIPARDAAVATSGTYRRTWLANTKQVHHILQGAHESAEQDVVSATVVHSTGAIADGYATTAVVLGAEHGARFLRDQQVPFILITTSGDVIQEITT